MEQYFLHAAPALRQRAYGVALHLLDDADEAEDVAQETMLRMWENRQQLHPQAGQLEAYATTVARNLCRNRRRSLARHPLLRLFFGHAGAEEAEATVREPADPAATPDKQIEEAEDELIYLRALQRLPYLWQRIVVMRGEEQREYADIARLLGTTEGNVRTTLCKARKRMAAIIAEMSGAAG